MQQPQPSMLSALSPPSTLSDKRNIICYIVKLRLFCMRVCVLFVFSDANLDVATLNCIRSEAHKDHTPGNNQQSTNYTPESSSSRVQDLRRCQSHTAWPTVQAIPKPIHVSFVCVMSFSAYCCGLVSFASLRRARVPFSLSVVPMVTSSFIVSAAQKMLSAQHNSTQAIRFIRTAAPQRTDR